MKKFILCLLSLLTISAFGQEEVFEKTIALKDQRVDIHADLANLITISNWDRSEVKVKVTYELNGGALNKAVELDLSEQKHRILLKMDINERLFRNTNVSDCDDKEAMWWGGRDDSRVCSNIMIEVFMPARKDLEVETVISDVFIEGRYNDLDVKTVTGDIDLTWPEQDGAEMELKTVNGIIHTNFNFSNSKKKGLPQISGHEVETIYKNGERYLRLETVTSDIYLRKG